MERGTDYKASMFFSCTWMTHQDVKEQPHQRPTPTPLDTLAGQRDNRTRERQHCLLVIIMRVCPANTVCGTAGLPII